LGCGFSVSFSKRSSVPNGVLNTGTSRTATWRLSTATVEMPNGGRLWVTTAVAKTSAAAAVSRPIGVPATSWLRPQISSQAPAPCRSGDSKSAWAW
jgi:hypothetical protein